MLWCTKKVWRWRIGGITSWRLLSGANWTCRIIKRWSHNCFKMFENIRNDSKVRILGVVQVEAERCWTVLSCMNSYFNSRSGKVYLPHIMTSDEIWIYYDNLKHRTSQVKPDHASISAAKPNIHGSKLLLCIWWDQRYLLTAPPNGQVWHKAFLWWIRAQGRSPHAPGICQKCLRPRLHSPY